jgi:hypothetical protein
MYAGKMAVAAMFTKINGYIFALGSESDSSIWTSLLTKE